MVLRTDVRRVRQRLRLLVVAGLALAPTACVAASRVSTSPPGFGNAATSIAPGDGSPTTSSTYVLSLDEFARGQCVIWDQHPGRDLVGPTAAETRIVACSKPHLAEVITGPRSIEGFGLAYPPETELNAYIQTKCVAAANDYLGYALDPYGRFGASAITPTAQGWVTGDRTYWCVLELRVANDKDDLTPFALPVKNADQTLLAAIGTCIPPGVGGDLGTGTVPCSLTHAIEISGYVDLASRSSTLPATDAGWDAVMGDSCAQVGKTYVGGPYPAGVQDGWFKIEPSSWAAGRRTVECTLARYDGNGTIVPSTGALRAAPAARTIP